MGKRVAVVACLVGVVAGAVGAPYVDGFLRADLMPAGKHAATSAPGVVLATVNGVSVTDVMIEPLRAAGLDKANAVDRAINRVVAAEEGRKLYRPKVDEVMRGLELEAASSVYAQQQMEGLLKQITDADIQQRYDTLFKDVDFNGYQLYFAMFPSEEEAKAARAEAQAGKADAIALFKPVATDADGNAGFVARSEVPYNLGVFVAKLKEGGYTEPALVRNGVIVLHAKHIKQNTKPTLMSVRDMVRRTIADERLASQLAELRKKATISLK